MLARVKITNDLWIDVEASAENELFKKISRVQEAFGHGTCGACGSHNVRFSTRTTPDGTDWMEVVCQERNCKAKLPFGTKKGNEGIIFPKVKWNNLSDAQRQDRAEEEKYADEHYGYLPNGGWFQYKRKD